MKIQDNSLMRDCSTDDGIDEQGFSLTCSPLIGCFLKLARFPHLPYSAAGAFRPPL